MKVTAASIGGEEVVLIEGWFFFTKEQAGDLFGALGAHLKGSKEDQAERLAAEIMRLEAEAAQKREALNAINAKAESPVKK